MKKHLVDKFGLNLSSLHKDAFSSALQVRMSETGVTSEEQYEQLYLSGKEEQQAFIELLVISETWFYRDRSAFEYFAHYLSTRKGHKPLRVLCVACSTGEEAYSIAMSLLDAGMKPHGFTIQAFDISKYALEKAKRAQYGIRSFRGDNLAFRQRYFDKDEEGHYHLHEKVRKLVEFNYGNVLHMESQVEHASYDVIFCCNLLIYLHEQARLKILRSFHHMLGEEGILIVGAGETALPCAAGFVSVKYPGSHAFSKSTPSKPSVKKAVHAVHKEERKLVPPKESLLVKAGELADSGHLDRADEMAHKHLEKHPNSAEAYFIIGLIAHAKGIDGEAHRSFEQVVYLDPDHYEALIYLALLVEKEGDLEKAARIRTRAATLLKKKDKGF